MFSCFALDAPQGKSCLPRHHAVQLTMTIGKFGTFDNYFFTKSRQHNILIINYLRIMSVFWLILRRMTDGICGTFAGFWSPATIPSAEATPLLKSIKDAGCRKGFAGFHPFAIDCFIL
jgi:hypothetical protein